MVKPMLAKVMLNYVKRQFYGSGNIYLPFENKLVKHKKAPNKCLTFEGNALS